MSDPRLGGRPHLDFCSGGEFCSLDDCLCDCHIGCATRALTDLRERVGVLGAWHDDQKWPDDEPSEQMFVRQSAVLALIDDAIAAQKGAS